MEILFPPLSGTLGGKSSLFSPHYLGTFPPLSEKFGHFPPILGSFPPFFRTLGSTFPPFFETLGGKFKNPFPPYGGKNINPWSSSKSISLQGSGVCASPLQMDQKSPRVKYLYLQSKFREFSGTNLSILSVFPMLSMPAPRILIRDQIF